MPRMIDVQPEATARVRQGDVFRDVEHIQSVQVESGVVEIQKIVFPHVMVLTQDCDLKQDDRFRLLERPGRSQDKLLFSVLVAPLYNAEHVYRGEHLSELDMTMQTINAKKSPGNYLRDNQLPRYHYLEFPPEIQIVSSVIDFKHYFTVNVEYLKTIKQTGYVCSISPLFREDISQRFASFLARIGLPEAAEGADD